MINIGIVQKINKDTVTLKLFKTSSCSHCSSCPEGIQYGDNFEIKIKEKVNIGDYVTLEISTGKIMKAAAITYFIPPVFMILGYLISDYLGYGEMTSVASSFGFLVLYFVFLFFFDKFFVKKKMEQDIKVVDIVTPDEKEFVDSCHI